MGTLMCKSPDVLELKVRSQGSTKLQLEAEPKDVDFCQGNVQQ